MPNLAFPVFRACLLVPLGLGLQVAHAVGGTTSAKASASGVMAVSVQVVATCIASTRPGAGAAASCQDRTAFVLSREMQLSQVAPDVQVLTIRY
jgi:hypothetical protein